MELVRGTVIANRFRLVRQLGCGGMGMVWSAQHVGLDTPCALKFIHEESAWDANHRARFEREAKVVAQLRSPHVVQVVDYGVHEDVPYIAMELLLGEDLGCRLARVGRLSAQETVTIVTQIARALSKAHTAELVHRDLKPENVFLVPDDDGEIVKVLDFGIAKTMNGGLGDQRTKTGALVGTPRFMSPEQAQGVKSVDHRSDLWSLAVIAYRCLTGRLPFDSDAIGDLLMSCTGRYRGGARRVCVVRRAPAAAGARPPPGHYGHGASESGAPSRRRREHTDRVRTHRQGGDSATAAAALTLCASLDARP